MPRIADYFFKGAISFLILGIVMGLQMSISGQHNVIGAHAHTNLLGWVSMAIFGTYYGLNPAKAETRLAAVHFWAYLGAVSVMVPSLYLLYLGYGGAEPLVAVSSMVAFAAVIVFALVVFAPVRAPRAAVPAE